MKGENTLVKTIHDEISAESLYTIYKSLINQNDNESKELLNLMENRFMDEDKSKFNLNSEETIILGLLELEIMKAKIFKSFKNRIDYESHLDGHMPPLCVIVQDGHVIGIEIDDIFIKIKFFEMFPKLISTVRTYIY